MQQHAVADAGGFVRADAMRHAHDDARGRAVRLVPFVGCGNQVAVAVTSDDVGEDRRRERARVVQGLAAPLQRAVVGKFAKRALERGAVGILQAEGAGDLADTDWPFLRGDEGQQLVF